jgi:hypothetical protein
MAGLIAAGPTAIVATAALYLLALGVCALIRPEYARRFLEAHASTRLLHFTELGLRILVGVALIAVAPRMAFASAFLLAGRVLVASSVALAVVPWQLHQRFAAWSVPRAMPYLPLIGSVSIAGGLGLIAAVVRSRAVG